MNQHEPTTRDRFQTGVRVLEEAVRDLGQDVGNLRQQLSALVGAVERLRPGTSPAEVVPGGPDAAAEEPPTPPVARASLPVRAAKKLLRLTLGSARRVWQASAPAMPALQGLELRLDRETVAAPPSLGVVVEAEPVAGREEELTRQRLGEARSEVALWNPSTGALAVRAAGSSAWSSSRALSSPEVLAALRSDLVLSLPRTSPPLAPELVEVLGWVAASEGVQLIQLVDEQVSRQGGRDLLLCARRLWNGFEAPVPAALAQAAQGSGPVFGKIVSRSSAPGFLLVASGSLGPGSRAHLRREGPYYLATRTASGWVRHRLRPLAAGSGPVTGSEPFPVMVVVTSPLAGGVEVWLGDLLGELVDAVRVVLLVATGPDPLTALRTAALRALGVSAYPLGGFLDQRLWPSVVVSMTRRLGARRVLHVGSGGPVLEELLKGEHGVEVVDLPLDESGCRVVAPETGRARPSVLLAPSAASRSSLDRSGGVTLRCLRLALPTPPPIPAEGRRDHVRASLGLPRDARLVLMVSDLLPVKRPEDFVALAHRLRDHEELRFLLVGEGPLAGAVLDLARYYALPRFTLEPPRLPLADLVVAADVVVSTAEAEPFPHALLQALAQRTPVVAPAVDDVAELLARAGERGAVVARAGDVDGLARAVIRLLAVGSGPAPPYADEDSRAETARQALRDELLGRAGRVAG